MIRQFLITEKLDYSGEFTDLGKIFFNFFNCLETDSDSMYFGISSTLRKKMFYGIL